MCFLIEKLQNSHRSKRSLAVSLQYNGVSGSNSHGNHPTPRNHSREVHGNNAGNYAKRCFISSCVVTGGYIHRGFALQKVRNSASQLCRLNSLLYISSSLTDGLSKLLGTKLRQLFLMLNQNISPGKHILGSLGNRHCAPSRKSFLGRGNCSQNLFLSTAWYLSNYFSGTGIRNRHIFIRLRGNPLTVDAIVHSFYSHVTPPL